MKNENVLKGLLTDKITSKLIMFLAFLIILTFSAAHAQNPYLYDGQGVYLRQYLPEFWKSTVHDQNYPRLTYRKYVQPDENSPVKNKPLNDLEKMEESTRLGSPMSFHKVYASVSDTGMVPSHPIRKGETPFNFNPVKIVRNIETGHSSHIYKNLRNENSGDLERNHDFVSDLGYYRPSRDEASREINNPDFRIVNSNGRVGGGGGRRQPTDWYRADKFVPSMDDCTVKTDSLCESFKEGYPSQHISELLNKDGVPYQEFFGKDRSEEEISERINLSDESSLCASRHEVIFPKAAKNTEDKWLFIINQDKYIQGISVELCIKPNTSCEFTQGFPSGYTPICKQRYIERRMIALGEEGKIISDSFWVPSCCVCVLNNSGMLPKS